MSITPTFSNSASAPAPTVLRLLGISRRESGASSGDSDFVVHHIMVDFLKPAPIDDVLEVHTRMAGSDGVRMSLDQRILAR